ncbi:MAG: hypothetical protein JNL58_11160 [Planctomyces sp.]|nr:hypothetical protein [Planctomyces sp.]
MKFVRNLSMLVLLACVSLSVGCTPASESTGGSTTPTTPAAGGEEAGSGVAGGSPAPATP